MDKENRHIDHIFKEGLHDFEMQPTDSLWDNIADQLPKKKKKRRIIVLFPLGIAASLALLFSIFYINKNATITDIQHQWTFEEDTPCPLIIKEKILEEAVVIVDKSANETTRKVPLYTNPSKNSIKKQERFASYKKSASNSKNIAYVHPKENETPVAITPSEKKLHPLNDIAQEPEKIIEQPFNNKLVENPSLPPLDTLPKIKESLEKENIKKWSIQPQLAQLNYESLSGNSTFGDNISTQEFNTSLSYGVKVAYHPTDRLAIRGGLSSTQITINTPLQSSFDFSSVQGFIDNPTIPDASESPTPVAEPDPDPLNQNDNDNPDTPIDREDSPSTPTFVQGEFEQQISYLEIPLEVSYKLIDKRFGLSIIGGVSTFVLVENKSNASFLNGSTQEFDNMIDNLNPTVFSNNFGIGLHYNINKTIKFNVEPTVKVQWNAFNSETNFRPYIFGIYSGISFQL